MKRFYGVLLLLALLCAPAPAQEVEGEAAKSSKPASQASTTLAVEIRQDKDRVTFIPGDRSAWFSRFERLAGWRQPVGFLPVRAVDVSSQVESETTLKLNVSVILGRRYHDEKKLVATYSVRERDHVVVEELREYGLAPVGLRVVRTKPAATAALPYVENRTSALELTGIEARETTFPSYVVRLRNLSGKDIAALQVYFHTAKGQGNTRPQQPQNEPLIKAGAVFELNARSGNDGELTPDGYAPNALHKVTIATAVFTDGTFEGEPLPAAQMRALWHGRKLQLTRVLALLNKNLQPGDADGAPAVERFRQQVEALGEDDGSSAADELAAEFNSLGADDKLKLRQLTNFELHQVKFNLLKAIAKFESEHARPLATDAYRKWLAGVKETYEQWLARL